MTSPTKTTSTSALSDEQIINMVENDTNNIRKKLQAKAPKSSLITGQLADAQKVLNEQPLNTAASSSPMQAPPAPPPPLPTAPAAAARAAAAPVEQGGFASASEPPPDIMSSDDYEDGDEDDEADDEPLMVLPNRSIGNPVTGPSDVCATDKAKSLEMKVAEQEKLIAYLLQQVQALPGMVRQALQGGGDGGGPTGFSGPPSGPAGGGLANALGGITQLAGLAKQIGLFGGEQKTQAGANQFMEQMAQYLQIQNAMESLQMQKFNNTTVWLARMAKMFSGEAFKKLGEVETEALKDNEIATKAMQAALVPAKVAKMADDEE